MRAQKKLLFPIIIIFIVLFSGIFGYMFIEGWNFLDSIYMTIITLSTVGYGEVHNIGPGGRIFTILLILFGVSIIAYIVGLLAETLVESEIRSILGRRKLGKKIESLKNHYIICGQGIGSSCII
jgi:voltage-gated potassium channel